MLTLAAKVLHKTINSIPGVRFRLWMEYRCSQACLCAPAGEVVKPFLAAPENADNLYRLKPDAGAPERLAERMARGNECWAVRIGEEWVYSQWVTVNRGDREMELEEVARTPRGMSLAPGGLYFWDAWCAPAWRGRGLNKQVKYRIMERCFTEGMEEAVTLILPFNRSNRRSVSALGFRFRRLRLELKLEVKQHRGQG